MKTFLAKIACFFTGHTWAHLRNRHKNGFTTYFFYCRRCKTRRHFAEYEQPMKGTNP